MGYIDFALRSFIGSHSDIIVFWLGYIELTAFLSVLLHIVLFKNELKKDYPDIPYNQDTGWLHGE